jgi:spore coat polysaccharide biosynthesis protein SpsF
MITDQEKFWAGEFGNEYIQRNTGSEILASKTIIFATSLRKTNGVRSFRELGANVGLNILALQRLFPNADFQAIEINAQAFGQLSAIQGLTAFHSSLLDPVNATPVDLCFTCGVLIHIAPELLQTAYTQIYTASKRYILMVEYYNPTPIEVTYQGHAGKLFKRDFAGDMMDLYPDLRLVDYGFFYRRDPNFPIDDSTWFLLEKMPLNYTHIT